ncbi:Crp/Fnr family transcriptional regulator [Myroides odoratimimus]|uniref:Crp/Fnr family transcriptional regulator n=1 Tax=Myroides odoratimimus TaxID=76832 RepID=UPI000469F184|nr:Crp/Fnr family transcriptional regulator [Myroides odoratimimus]
MIDLDILIKYNGYIKDFDKNQVIITECEEPKFYYQIVHGKVKMNNYNQEGKEFIQAIFSDGESFGEPPIFAGFNYPANAIALVQSSILLICKEDFFKLLENESECCFRVLQALSSRLYYKSIMAPEISSNDSEKRILTLLYYIKSQQDNDKELQIDLTRQQIADMTGLRVETVIRSIKEIEHKQQLRIERGKLYI